MKYLGRFEKVEDAKKCAKEKNGFVKKQSYKSGETTLTYYYVYPEVIKNE